MTVVDFMHWCFESFWRWCGLVVVMTIGGFWTHATAHSLVGLKGKRE